MTDILDLHAELADLPLLSGLPHEGLSVLEPLATRAVFDKAAARSVPGSPSVTASATRPSTPSSTPTPPCTG